MKKLSKIVLTVTMIASLATVMGCSKKEGTTNKSSSAVKYTDIELGKTDTDLTATIKMLTHRTDMLNDEYSGKTFAAYLAEFNKLYPNITVEIEGITDYASTVH